MPPPSMVSTEAVFDLRESRRVLSDWYVGGPVILVGVSGKESRISAGVGTEDDIAGIMGTGMAWSSLVQIIKRSSLLY